ncbi:MAG TPA: TIGR02117 family protein [Bacteroidia bacterium]|jgi:uncharacterized protein (TIGR02117 family)|nr:TIGR02117 family protein [Bacteroidia bacterium]
MMRPLLEIIKYTGYAFGLFLCLVLLYLLAAYIVSRISVNGNKTNSVADIEIYILTNGVHTDLVLPIKSDEMDWSKAVKFENTVAKDTLMKYIAFGWGDKGFYLETPNWSDLKMSVAFKAMFYLGKSAMHTTFYKEMNEGETCVKIKLSISEYKQLNEYIRASFQIDTNGSFIHIKNHSYGDNDSFYEAKRVYGLFYTCNTWTNNGLKACGQKACLWTPFDKGIFYQYRK